MHRVFLCLVCVKQNLPRDRQGNPLAFFRKVMAVCSASSVAAFLTNKDEWNDLEVCGPFFQTPRNSSDKEILKVRAIFSMFTSERFRSPRSMPPT